MDLNLRSATADDIETILYHRRQMFVEMGGDYKRTLPRFEPASRHYFEAAFKSGTYVGLFGEIDGCIVAGGGVVIADWPGSPLNLEPKRAWILNIYVEPSYRHRGYARTITQNLIEWCGSNGFQSVALHASEFGRTLYEKLGFTSTNEMRLIL